MKDSNLSIPKDNIRASILKKISTNSNSKIINIKVANELEFQKLTPPLAMLIYGYVCLGFLGCGFETKPNNRPNEGVVVKLLLEKTAFV